MTEHREESTSFFDEPVIPQASQDLQHLRAEPGYSPPFEVLRWRVVDEVRAGVVTIDAIVVIRVEKKEDLEAAQGVGGINALDLALRKALIKRFPFLCDVRVVESYTHGSGEGTDAEVISVRKFSDGKRWWTTMRRSRDIVESGWLALVDGYEWAVLSKTKGLAR
jgi:2-isopropylmalate synthase